jgi:O-antigen ligase
MLLRFTAAAYGGWLFLILAAFYHVSGHDENFLQYAVMLGVIPAGLQIMLLGFNSRGLAVPLFFSIAILLSVLISYLASPGYIVDWTPVIYTVNVIFLLSLGILVAGSPDPRLMASIAAIYAVITSVFLVYINLKGAYLWGRLIAGLQPNFWGLIGLSVAVSALGFRRLAFAAPPILVGCWTIYNASSRSAIVGLAAAILAIAIRAARELRGTRLYLALGGIAAGAMLVALFWSSLDVAAVNIVGNDLLKLDDPYRGLGTGFSGREDLWTGTLDVWLRDPIFGVGFRESAQILDYPSHNGYLAMLADTGIFGLLVYCALLGAALRAAWRVTEPSTRNLAITTIVAYAVMSLFEARAINTGNPFGFLIVMVCFIALVFEVRRRLPAARPTAQTGAVLRVAHERR